MQYGYGGGYGGAYGPRMSTMPMQGMPGLQPIPPVGGGFWGAQNLSYPYELPRHDYTPQEWWEPTDYARARYPGVEPGLVESLLSTVREAFSRNYLSYSAAMDSHRRVYHEGEGVDANNKTLGGAAAFEALMQWDANHHHASMHSTQLEASRGHVIGLAIGELRDLWSRVQPRSSRANMREAGEYAAATAKHLFDKSYGAPYYANHGYNVPGAYRSYEDERSETFSDREDQRRRRWHRHHRPEYGYDPAGVHGMPPPGAGFGGMAGGYGFGQAYQPGFPGQFQPGIGPGMGAGYGYGYGGGGYGGPGMGPMGLGMGPMMPGASGMGMVDPLMEAQMYGQYGRPYDQVPYADQRWYYTGGPQRYY